MFRSVKIVTVVFENQGQPDNEGCSSENETFHNGWFLGNQSSLKLAFLKESRVHFIVILFHFARSSVLFLSCPLLLLLVDVHALSLGLPLHTPVF